ncbi:SPOR domain-containing protein [Sphingobium abikonense]|uniref:SPOR domain-containing protein n=1 Tax=Sphingobium abikonense TaxID=86193 RepID=UPI0035199F90
MTKSLPWILCALLLAPPAIAQTDQADLVRPLSAADLNSNLARLASNPRDVDALIGAGEAALALDDPHGAAGFFARADAIASGNGRIKAGLARVMLKLQNPAEAVRLFDQAQRLGFPEASILTERGLARDLTGDQAGAQRDYQAALARSPDNAELRRRYAASLGISGQVDAAEKMLEPLLYKSDRAAWRYRAFIYAMNNRQADAQKVAEQAMPAQLAAAITPYMQKMPYLTAQQKAAAVHFGQFPSQVGTAVAAVTPTAPPPATVSATPATKPATQVAQAPARTVPTRARPLSRAEQRRQRREAARLARAGGQRAPTPEPTPGFSTASQPASTAVASATNNAPAPDAPTQVAQAQTVQSLPARAAQPVVQPLPQAQKSASASASASTPPQQPTARVAVSAVQGPPAPGFDMIDGSTPPAATPPPATGAQGDSAALAQASPPPAAASTPSAPPAPDPQATRTLADIIRAIDVPDAERQPTVAAVDLNEIAAMQAAQRAERQAAAAAAAAKAKKEAAAKAKAEADAKAKKEAEEKKRLAANPSRNWLQVGVGQSKSALAFTMKRLRGKYDSIAPQDAWTAGWGQTNRLLVGPFPSFARAKELETKLKAAGADVFAWKSDAGEVVEKLAGE